MPKEKYFARLRILNLCIKFFVNPFVDIALTFSDSSFNSFSISTCFILFEVTFLSKSVFFTKLTISFLLAKFACANLAVTFSAANLLNS